MKPTKKDRDHLQCLIRAQDANRAAGKSIDEAINYLAGGSPYYAAHARTAIKQMEGATVALNALLSRMDSEAPGIAP